MHTSATLPLTAPASGDLNSGCQDHRAFPPTPDPVVPAWSVTGSIAPPKLSIFYTAALAIVAVAMIILPLAYLALVGGLGCATWYHATRDTFLLGGTGREAVLRLLVYATPILGGVVTVLFMIKPLFASRQRPPAAITLARAGHPELFAFIDRICDLISAPRPVKVCIDSRVNASASFASPLSIFRGGLVLTIGLPLVRGLTLRQFGGVLAHEFGHFTQGGGMRLSYLIRSINGWFARVAYERDQWDDRLAAASESGVDVRLTIVLGLVRFMVWLTRMVLVAFTWIGHALSCYLLRQMEYDADHYEAEVAGSDEFARTATRLLLLGAGQQEVMATLNGMWGQQQLVDDVVEYIALETERLPHARRTEIEEAGAKAKTGIFDSHPCNADRIRKTAARGAAGVLQSAASADVLFNGFSDLSKAVTLAFYSDDCDLLLDVATLHPVTSIAKNANRNAETGRTSGTYYRDLVTPHHRVFLRPADFNSDAPIAEILAANRAAREILEAGLAPKLQMSTLGELHETQLCTVATRRLLDAGVKLDRSGISHTESPAEVLTNAIAAGARKIAEVEAMVTERAAAARTRLATALQILHAAPRALVAERDQLRSESLALAALVGRFEAMDEKFAALEQDAITLDLLGKSRTQASDMNLYRASVESATAQLKSAMQAIAFAFDELPDPADATESRSVATLLTGVASPGLTVAAAVRGMNQRRLECYLGAMGRLAAIAAETEAACAENPQLLVPSPTGLQLA